MEERDWPGYCGRHREHYEHDSGEGCPSCFRELLAENPSLAPMFRRQRLWSRAYVWFIEGAALLILLASLVFAAVREWRIWFR